MIDLVFIRVCINFLSSLGTVRYSGKHVINDVPRKYWKLLLVRCIAGTLGFTCLVYSVQAIPLFISIIIFNTTPFIASILGYFFLGDKVSKVEIKLMLGCFIGVVALALAKGGFLMVGPPHYRGPAGGPPGHRFLRHSGYHGGGHGGRYGPGNGLSDHIEMLYEDYDYSPSIFGPDKYGAPPPPGFDDPDHRGPPPPGFDGPDHRGPPPLGFDDPEDRGPPPSPRFDDPEERGPPPPPRFDDLEERGLPPKNESRFD